MVGSQKHIVVLSGSGVSAESGIMTFRDMGGLWQQYDVTQVASPQGWRANPQLVMDFYNQRRRQLLECKPNKGHQLLAALESDYKVSIVTQNVDNLHEIAGSTTVLHLHGELMKARSTGDEGYVTTLSHWELKIGDTCPRGFQLRPHIVWFGEQVPLLDDAIGIVQSADLLVVIGTSLTVYPAAGLINYVSAGVPVVLIDPVAPSGIDMSKITFIKATSSEGVQTLQGVLPKLLKR